MNSHWTPTAGDAGVAHYTQEEQGYLDTAVPLPQGESHDTNDPDLVENVKPAVPMAYAEQIIIEPVAYGTWQQQPPPLPPPQPQFLDDDNKDLISFIFILVLGIVCVAILFYPFSYYDDDFYDKPHKP